MDSVKIEELFYLYSYSEHNSPPLFVLVSKMVKQNNLVKIIDKKLFCKRFIDNLYSFEIELDDDLMELDLTNLHHHQNLCMNFNNISLVLKIFYIPFRFSKIYDCIDLMLSDIRH